MTPSPLPLQRVGNGGFPGRVASFLTEDLMKARKLLRIEPNRMENSETPMIE